jgi:hypothetical protein
MRAIIILLMLTAPASAGRVSRLGSGTGDCPTRAWRVLVIGGEIQPNSWCDNNNKGKSKKGKGKRSAWENNRNKIQKQREAYLNRKQIDKAKRDERKRKEEAARKYRRDKAKADELDRKRKKEELKEKRRIRELKQKCSSVAKRKTLPYHDCRRIN